MRSAGWSEIMSKNRDGIWSFECGDAYSLSFIVIHCYSLFMIRACRATPIVKWSKQFTRYIVLCIHTATSAAAGHIMPFRTEITSDRTVQTGVVFITTTPTRLSVYLHLRLPTRPSAYTSACPPVRLLYTSACPPTRPSVCPTQTKHEALIGCSLVCHASSAIPFSCCASPAKVLHDLELQWMFMVVRMMSVRTADAGLHPMLPLPPCCSPWCCCCPLLSHAAAAAVISIVLSLLHVAEPARDSIAISRCCVIRMLRPERSCWEIPRCCLEIKFRISN